MNDINEIYEEIGEQKAKENAAQHKCAVLPEGMNGHKLNLTNWAVRWLYERFKTSLNIPFNFTLSDIQWENFEDTVLTAYNKTYKAVFGSDYVYPGLEIERVRMSGIIEAAVKKQKEAIENESKNINS